MFDWMVEDDLAKWKSRDPYKLKFYASQLYDLCPRQWALLMRLKREIVHDRNTPNDLLTFGIGHAYHDLFQNNLWAFSGLLHGDWEHRVTGEIHVGTCPDRSGHWRYKERRVTLPVPGLPNTEDWSIIGKIDADFSPDLGDLKSCSPKIYDWLDRGYSRLDDIEDWFEIMGEDCGWSDAYARKHTFQLTIYLYAADRERGWCMYVPKAKARSPQPPIKEFLVPKRPLILEAAHRKVEQSFRAWNGGDWEGPLPDMPCKSISCKLAQDCPVASECFKA